MKYRLVGVLLLVPEGKEGYKNMLTSYRDAHPDELVQMASHVHPDCDGAEFNVAAEAWKYITNGELTLPPAKV